MNTNSVLDASFSIFGAVVIVMTLSIVTVSWIFIAKRISKSNKEIEEFKPLDLKIDLNMDESQSRIRLSQAYFEIFSQYHEQGLRQSQNSFTFSMVCGLFGLIVIISAFGTVFYDMMSDGTTFDFWKPAILIFPGILIEVITVLILQQSHKARELMVGFFEKIQHDQSFNLALAQCALIEDQKEEDKIRIALIRKLVENGK
jgi:hypothetical protein